MAPSLTGISFTPKEVGEHVVSVKKSGKHVTNSPFRIMVGQSEIGDASKVKVFGQGLIEGHTLEVAEFIVDTRSAGDSHVHLDSDIQYLGSLTLLLLQNDFYQLTSRTQIIHIYNLQNIIDPHP